MGDTPSKPGLRKQWPGFVLAAAVGFVIVVGMALMLWKG